jgi:hypothetical protein
VPLVVAAALVAALAGPTAYSVDTVRTAHTGSIVTAGPNAGRGGPGRGGMPGGAPGTLGTPPQGGTAPGTTGGGQLGAAPGPGGGGIGGLLDAGTPNTEVVSALSAKAGAYRWVAAAVGSQSAADCSSAPACP